MLLTSDTVFVGKRPAAHAKTITNDKQQERNSFASNIPTLQGHFGVGHSKGTGGWALQEYFGVGHSRDHF